jgi:Ca2+-binding EF-hand superfamily protein
MSQRRLSTHHYLGTKGYAARLVNLRAPFDEYNGMLVRPTKKALNQYSVWIKDDCGDEKEMVLPARYFCVIVDHDHSEDLDHESKNAITQGNRTDVRLTLETLECQVRKALRQAMKERGQSTSELFLKFDADGSGLIDKLEFALGLKALGIAISPAEVELVWPVFDVDNSGEIDLQEFIQITSADIKSAQYRGGGVKEAKEKRMQRMSKQQRNDRITAKTNLQIVLKELACHFRRVVNRAAKERNVPTAGIFEEIDADGDGNGEVDRNEFMMGSSKLKMDLDAPQMKILWPLLTGGTTLPLSAEQWETFIHNPQDLNEMICFRELADKFATRFTHEDIKGARAALRVKNKKRSDGVHHDHHIEEASLRATHSNRCRRQEKTDDLASRARQRRQIEEQSLERLRVKHGKNRLPAGFSGRSRRANAEGVVTMSSAPDLQTALYDSHKLPDIKGRKAATVGRSRRGSVSLCTMTKFGKQNLRRLVQPKNRRLYDEKLQQINYQSQSQSPGGSSCQALLFV